MRRAATAAGPLARRAVDGAAAAGRAAARWVKAQGLDRKAAAAAAAAGGQLRRTQREVEAALGRWVAGTAVAAYAEPMLLQLASYVVVALGLGFCFLLLPALLLGGSARGAGGSARDRSGRSRGATPAPAAPAGMRAHGSDGSLGGGGAGGGGAAAAAAAGGETPGLIKRPKVGR